MEAKESKAGSGSQIDEQRAAEALATIYAGKVVQHDIKSAAAHRH